MNEVVATRVHAEMIEELSTNASGHLGRRYKDRANKLTAVDPCSLFPTSALDSYLRPATSSAEQGWPGFGNGEAVYQKRGKARSEGRGDLVGFAKACERFFEWGTKELVARKFSSESVGLFGSEIINCARERVRLRDPAPVVRPRVLKKGDGSPPQDHSPASRITSFFQSTSGRAAPASLPRRDSFTRLPDQINKIHSIRKDPTNPELNEYRISFSTSDYIQRCHGMMDGHRVDPKELDVNSRAEMGLVVGDTELDIPTASQVAPAKEEARVWMPGYLIKEAWPELLETYEAELAAKANPKSKSTGTTKKSKNQSRREDTQAFKSFFLTQRPTVAEAVPRHNSDEPEESEEEEVFENNPSRTMTSDSAGKSGSRSVSTLSKSRAASSVPSSLHATPPPCPTAVTAAKKNARPAPVSSSSSSQSSEALGPTAKLSGSRPMQGSKDTSAKPGPSPPVRRNARRSTRARIVRNNEVVDLCASSDDDSDIILVSSCVSVPPGLPGISPSRVVLAPIDKVNTPVASPVVSSAVPRSPTRTPIARVVRAESRSIRSPSRETTTCTLTDLPSNTYPGLGSGPTSPSSATFTQSLQVTEDQGETPVAPPNAVSTLKPKDKGKSKETATRKPKAKQTLLSMPIVRPMKETPVKTTATLTSVKAKVMKAPLFVVTYEDDEKMEMDVRERWARGQSVGAWEGEAISLSLPDRSPS